MKPGMKQECPACGQMLRISERQMSRMIRCSKCAHVFEAGQTRASSNSSIEMYPAADSVETVVNARLDTQTDGQQKVSTERPEQAPRTLGRFQLKRLLGQGGFGKVYLAFDPQLERNVAIKVLTAAGNSQIRIQRFMVEAKSAARLKHPYIVPTFESGKEDSRYYIASEFIEGNLLSDESTQKSLDERRAVACIQKLATALAYAHERQVVHRDIKPQNIILDAAGDPHLMDFGLARRTDEESNLTTDGAMLGTPAYMSPEQARGEFAKVGPASDQYSLAVVLYQLLCGSTPFDGLPHLVVTQVARGDVPPLKTRRPDISADLAAVCEKAMQKLPGDRYSSCNDFAEDLAAWMEGRPVAARPLGNIQKALRLVAAHRAIAGMALVTLVLIMVLAVSVWKIMTSSGDESTQVAGDSSNDAAELLQDEVVVVVTEESQLQPSAAGNKASNTTTKAKTNVATPDHAVTPFTAEAAKVLQKQWAEHLKLPVEFTNSLGMKFVLIPPGEFFMGTPKAVRDEHLEEVKDVAQWRECLLSEAPLHRVILTRPYYVGVYEVTQKEYALVMRGAPSHFSSSGAGAKLVSDFDTQQLPVESITWSEANDFCQKLGVIERSAAPADPRGALANLRTISSYLLPTEAEWEFACTAGTGTKFWSGDTPEDLQNVAWFRGNNADHTQPVGQLPANPFGLHDVHGNVSEWVGDIWAADFYSTSVDTPAVDPLCENPSGGPHVARGGGFGVSANHCRSSARHYGDSSTRLRDLGFRVVLEIDPVRSQRNSQLAESSGAGGAAPVKPNITSTASEQKTAADLIPVPSDAGIAALLGRSAEWEWGPPEKATWAGEDGSNTGTPSISDDGLTVAVSSMRPGGMGGFDIWISRREQISDPWPELTNPGASINSSAADWSPSLSADGNTLYFHSPRPDGKEGNIWVASRNAVGAEWQNAFKLPVSVNTTGIEQQPAISHDGLELMVWSNGPFSRREGELWQFKRQSSSQPFGIGAKVRDANPLLKDMNLQDIQFYSPDSLWAIFSVQGKSESGKTEVLLCRRDAVGAAWEDPQTITTIPGDSYDMTYSSAAKLLLIHRGLGNSIWQMQLVPRPADKMAADVPEPKPVAVPDVATNVPNASSTLTSSEIDLLSQINEVQCSYSGNWKRTANGLESPPGNGMRLQVPFLPDGEYDLALVVKPLEQKMGLAIGLVSDGHPFHVILDYYNGTHGLEQVDGLDVNNLPGPGLNASKVYEQNLLKIDQNNTILCRVRKNGVTVDVNEKPLVAWKGKPEQLSRNAYWDMPIDRSLFVGGFSRFEFSRITLTPVTGTVLPLPPWKLTSPESRTLAANALGVPNDTVERLASAWHLSLDDHYDDEPAIDVSPRFGPVSPKQGPIMSEDINLVSTLTCPARVMLSGLHSECWSSGTVQQLAVMKNLKRLYIADKDAMPSTFPAALSANRSLRELILDYQKLNEQQITEICKIPTLRRLQLNYTDLSDESVRIISSSLPELACLHIGHMGKNSRLTNDCVKSLSDHPGLNDLSIRDSQTINDQCIDDLMKLKKLGRLWIDGTAITKTGYDRLKSKMPNTQIIWKP